jgi:hypothetical protein
MVKTAALASSALAKRRFLDLAADFNSGCEEGAGRLSVSAEPARISRVKFFQLPISEPGQ